MAVQTAIKPANCGKRAREWRWCMAVLANEGRRQSRRKAIVGAGSYPYCHGVAFDAEPMRAVSPDQTRFGPRNEHDGRLLLARKLVIAW
jgi:hypothetical protein